LCSHAKLSPDFETDLCAAGIVLGKLFRSVTDQNGEEFEEIHDVIDRLSSSNPQERVQVLNDPNELISNTDKTQ
jgi:hypothetical protein